MVEPSSTSGQTVPHVSEDSTTLETFKTVTIAKRWIKIKKGNCHMKDPKDAASLWDKKNLSICDTLFFIEYFMKKWSNHHRSPLYKGGRR